MKLVRVAFSGLRITRDSQSFANMKVIWRRRESPHKGNIWGMYVVPETRGEGIGKSLLTEVIRRSHNLEGLEQIVLTVTSNNKSAKGSYENIGFRYYGVEKRALKIGRDYFDDEFMVLPIRNE